MTAQSVALERQMARLQTQLEQAQIKEAMYAELREFSWSKDDVLFIKFRFGHDQRLPEMEGYRGDRAYSYVAVCDGQYWHVTGQSTPNGATLGRLLDWFIDKGEILEVWSAAEWESVL